jgi:hypothetical protein
MLVDTLPCRAGQAYLSSCHVPLAIIISHSDAGQQAGRAEQQQSDLLFVGAAGRHRYFLGPVSRPGPNRLARFSAKRAAPGHTAGHQPKILSA